MVITKRLHGKEKNNTKTKPTFAGNLLENSKLLA